MTPADKVNELNEAEQPAVELLRRLGYTYVPRDLLAPERDNEREVLLKGRLKAALLRLNPWLKENDAERVIFALENLDAVGMARNRLAHEYLVYGLPLEEDDERVVKPDIVLFVNGIPLIVIEAKSPTLLDVWKTRAVRQLHRYQEAGPEWHGSGAPELFHYNLACVAICGADAAYGAIGAPENAYAGWKSLEPWTEGEVRERLGVEPKGQVSLIVGMLSPANLLEILRDFVVFEPERGRLVKKLPRYQQFRAVHRAMERLLTHDKPEERGGVVWHTQGSGKSLTMLWLATKLRREPRLDNPAIII